MNFMLQKVKTHFLLPCLAFLALSTSLYSDGKENNPKSVYPKQKIDSSTYQGSYNSSFTPQGDSSFYSPSVSYSPYASVSYNPTFSSDVVLFDLCDLNTEQLFEGYLDQEDTSFIIRCTAGTQFVIDYDLDCEYFHIGNQSGNGNYVSFTIDKTFYTCNLWVEKTTSYFEDDEEVFGSEYYVGTFFSDDLENWKTVEDFFGFSIGLKCVKAAPNTLFFSIVKENANHEIPSFGM